MTNKKVWKREEARRLRSEGYSLKEIAELLSVSKSSVSYWVRGVELTDEQKNNLHRKKAEGSHAGRVKGSQVNRERALEKRKEAQLNGKTRAKEGSLLHAMGCILYWAEGAKRRNNLYFVNSDPFMMLLFIRFLREEMNVPDSEMVLNIHCHNEQDIPRIEEYWTSLLNLPKSALRKTQVKKGSKTRFNILENGVCGLSVYNTDLTMHVFGAIQEYGGFENADWLF